MLPCLKRLKSPSEAKRDDPRRRLQFSLCITLRGTQRKHWNVCASGSLKGIKVSCLARACEATHEIVDSPMEFHRGEDDRSEAPFPTRHRRRTHEWGRKHLYEDEVAPWKLHKPHGTKIESIICNGRHKRPQPVKTLGRQPEKY
jgi:hypothetical protein